MYWSIINQMLKVNKDLTQGLRLDDEGKKSIDFMVNSLHFPLLFYVFDRFRAFFSDLYI